MLQNGLRMEVEVTKLETPKCPRCYDRNGIADNFMGMCDRCCKSCLEGAAQWVASGAITKEESEYLISSIKDAQKSQLEKYKNSLTKS